MRAVRIHAFGGPEVLHIDEVSKPEPASGEVRIKVEAIGVNRSEVMMRKGLYYPPAELPARIGLEAAGTIDALGAGVKSFKAGDRVGTLICLAGPKYFGAYAEYVVVPAAAVFATPENVSGEESAAIWMAFLAAWGALVQFGQLTAGQAVVITAAFSPVGLAAIQIARDLGAKVIASTTSTDKVNELKRRGADAVIDTSREDFVGRVKELTDDRGADLFFDPAVGGILTCEMEAAALDGRIIIYALLDMLPTTINPKFVSRGRRRIMGFTVAMLAPLPDVLDRAVSYIQQRVSDRTFRLCIAKTFKLEEVADAHRCIENDQQIGKIVMTP